MNEPLNAGHSEINPATDPPDNVVSLHADQMDLTRGQRLVGLRARVVEDPIVYAADQQLAFIIDQLGNMPLQMRMHPAGHLVFDLDHKAAIDDAIQKLVDASLAIDRAVKWGR